MLQKYSLLTLCLFLINLGFSQSSNQQQHNNDTERLSVLCKLWGFLKYYHPNVASGKHNWDAELVAMIPLVQKSESGQPLNQLLSEWVSRLGEVKSCNSCVEKPESFNSNFDLKWTQDNRFFSRDFSQKLKYIQENRFQGNNFYVIAGPHENIVTRNESTVPDASFPSPENRLLSLFRFWNTVEYFFPYKYKTTQKWDDVLLEMIPKFLNAPDLTQYHLAILETIVKLDDTHANLYTNAIHDFFGRKYIPAKFSVIQQKAVITGFYDSLLAQANDIMIGDIIEKVDGIDVTDLLQNRSKYVNGSNHAAKNRNYDFTIFNGNTDSVTLTITRNKKMFAKTVGRYDEKLFKPTPEKKLPYRIIGDKVGYVDMATLQKNDVDKMFSDFKSTEAMVIDLRNYPNFLPYTISERLVDKETEFAKILKPDMQYPGKFVWKPAKKITPHKNKKYPGKVILLVNQETQSAAEYAAMMLQAGSNVATVGSQTAGADGDISSIDFLGFKLFISGLGIFYPNLKETQRIGIKIDTEVNPTAEDITLHKDIILETALKQLK